LLLHISSIAPLNTSGYAPPEVIGTRHISVHDVALIAIGHFGCIVGARYRKVFGSCGGNVACRRA
jgi:hypothetical protein